MDAATETGKRIARTEAYAEKVRRLFAATVNEILAMNKTIPSLEEGVMFSFDGQSVKKQKEVEGLLRRLHSLATLSIEKGMELEWGKANDECDRLLTSIFGKGVLETPQFAAWVDRNTNAMRAFIERSDAGMNLSDRVWKSVRQLREEMEMAMTVAIGEGDSASSISRKVRQYLDDPDLMFRRFRYKAAEEIIFDDEGNEIGRKPIYAKKWKKRVKDQATGKYKWIDYTKDDYKTGRGVYKSSAKNAMRVARTETNMAYRKADNERWKRMDFVLGQRIQLSNSHPMKDICDTLAGDYPKEFVFEGWHPQCFCFVTPILMDEDEMAKMSDAFLEGKEYKPKGKPVKDYPDAFKRWVKDNSEKIVDAHDYMRDPYFVRHNWAIVNNILHPRMSVQERARIRHEARTQAQIDDIKARAAERQKRHALILKTANNVLKIASDYGEVDYAKLKQFITDGNLTAMRDEAKIVAKRVSAIKKKEIALSDLIPDIHGWHKQFSMADLEVVYDAIKKKLDSISNLSLQKQADKLIFEIKYVEDPSKYKYGAIKYPTWKISQDAYSTRLSKIQYLIYVEDIKAKIQPIKDYLSKSKGAKKLSALINDLDDLIKVESEQSVISAKYADIEKRWSIIQKSNATRKSNKSASNRHIIFDDSNFTSQRKSNAFRFTNSTDADSYFLKDAIDAYDRASSIFKEAAESYTTNSASITRLLRAMEGWLEYDSYYVNMNKPYIEAMTDMIAETRLRNDCWIVRDERASFFSLKNGGIDVNILNSNIENYKTKIYAKYRSKYGSINAKLDKEIKEKIYNYKRHEERQLIDRIGTDPSFCSTSSHMNARFSGTGGDNKNGNPKVHLEIYCPKGTQALYAAPYNHYNGKNIGSDGFWDGKSKPTYIHEAEVFLQRGSKFRVTHAEYDEAEDIWNIKVEVIEQNPIEIIDYEYVYDKSKGRYGYIPKYK